MAKQNKDGLQQWYEDDARRVNEMAEYFRTTGKMIQVPDQPPELNADGTTKREGNDDGRN